MSDRREEILAAARSLAAEQGMSSLSVRTVAARAGIGASTLRHYFPSQRVLYDAVLGEVMARHLQDLRIRDESVPPGERLAECLAQFLPDRDAVDGALESWFATVVTLVGPDATPELRRGWAALVRHSRARVEQWLEILAGQGLLRQGEPARHARLLLATVDGIGLAMLMPEGALTRAEADEVLSDVVGAVVRDAR